MSVRLYRPFPDQVIAAVRTHAAWLSSKRHSYGYEGALCSDVKAALYGGTVDGPNDEAAGGAGAAIRPFVRVLVAGIGGRDIRTADLNDTLRDACRNNDKGPGWIGMKI